MDDSVLGVGRTQWGLIVSWMWGIKESVESKLTPGFGLSEEEVSINQDNARKYRHLLLFSHQVLSDSATTWIAACSLLPSPGVCPSSCPLHWWCHPIISSSDALFSFCPQSFLSSGSFPMSWLFTSGGQNTEASDSASVFPMSIQGWFPIRLTGLISLQSKGLSGVFFNTTVRRNQFFDALPSLWSSSHNHIWPLGRP